MNTAKEYAAALIKERISELKNISILELRKVNYRELTEKQKIPLRILAAEIITLENVWNNKGLDAWLSDCIENEQYCGAEGIKRAKEWLESKQVLSHLNNMQQLN